MADLYIATLPHYCCGFEVDGNIIVDAAPIMRWAVGKSLDYYTKWAKSHNGSIELVNR